MTNQALYPEFYNDVFGPIMQPGSSSHTAGPCRLGYLAHGLLGQEPAEIQVFLDRNGSFAGTFGVMSEDSGMIAGALGMLPDDPRLFDSRNLARARGIPHSFAFTDLIESQHPNAIKFVLSDAGGRSISLVGESTGGGMVQTCLVNGIPLHTKGESHLLLIFDPDETLTPSRTGSVADRLRGLVETGQSRKPDGGVLHFWRTAEAFDLPSFRAEFAPYEVAKLPPILPVLDSPARKPQLFTTMTRWREIAEQQSKPLWEVAVDYEMCASGWTSEEVLDYMRMIAGRMQRQTHAPYDPEIEVPVTPFRPNMAQAWDRHMGSPRRLTSDLTAHTLRLAWGAGAGVPGVETVPGPMGGGGGYIYAALHAVGEAHGFTDDDLLRGLFIAAGIGAIAFSRTEPTGEVTGCTGECGVCGAMAAAGIAEMAGAAPAQVESAASLALQATIGIPCDPIPGGMGQPCRTRAMTAACMAHVFADIALAGRDAVLPLHEVIDVADAVGRALPPELLCTSRGGCAATPTAQKQEIAFREWFDRSEEEGLPRQPGNLI